MLLLQGVFKEEQRRKSGELEIQAAEQQPAEEGSAYPEQTFAELEDYQGANAEAFGYRTILRTLEAEFELEG